MHFMSSLCTTTTTITSTGPFFICRSTDSAIIGNCMIEPLKSYRYERPDLTFLNLPIYADYWYNMFDEIYRMPLEIVWWHLIHDLHIAGTLVDYTINTITDEMFEHTYQSMLAKTISKMDYSFLSDNPIWSSAIDDISGRGYYRLYMLIIHKAHSIGVLSYMNSKYVTSGQLEKEYSRALFEHLPTIIGRPDFWEYCGIKHPPTFEPIIHPRCDERCHGRPELALKGHIKRTIGHPKYDACIDDSRVCEHLTHTYYSFMPL